MSGSDINSLIDQNTIDDIMNKSTETNQMAPEDDVDSLEDTFGGFFGFSATRSIENAASRKENIKIINTTVTEKFNEFKLYGKHLTPTDTDTAFSKVTGDGNKKMDSKLFEALVKEVAPKYQKDQKDCATTDDAYDTMWEEIIRVASINSAVDTLSDIEERCRKDDIQKLLRGSTDDVLVARDFQRDVEWKLLRLLRKVGNLCSKMSGKHKNVAVLSCLGSPEGHTIKFLTLAIKDIVRDKTEGICALKDTLRALMAKNFGESHLKTLRLFRKLAGFLYDKKAVEFLIKMSTSMTTGNPAEWRVRLAMLRFVQVAGEYFQRLLPSTLMLHIKLPALQKILQDLRNFLSHLNRAQLEKAKETSKSTNDRFKKLQENIKLLRETLEELLKMLNSRSMQPPDVLWANLKELPEDTSWEGFKCLQDFLKLSVPGQRSDLTTYAKECKDLLRFPFRPLESTELNNYIELRTTLTRKITDTINHNYSSDSQVKEAAKSISEMSPVSNMTVTRCEDLLRELINHKTSIKDLKHKQERKNGSSDQTIDSNQKKIMEDDLVKLKEDFVDKAMGVSSDQHAQITAQPNDCAETEIHKQREALDAQLQNISSCRGRGNLSEKYTKFVQVLKDAKVDVSEKCRHFSWLGEPASTIEKLFHRVHKTGIFSKSDKDALRITRIQDVLEAMDVFQVMTDINSPDPVTTKPTASNGYLCQLARFDKVKALKNNYRQNMPRPITKQFKEHFEKDETSLYAHQFLLATIYDMAKEIKDYPELACMRATIEKVRNIFCHSNPFKDEPLIIDPGLFKEFNIFINDPPGELAKEMSLLVVNMRLVLEDLADSLRNDSR